MNFGEIVKGLLEEKEMSQKLLADELNILPPTLGRYIRGEREPDIDTIKLIASYFNVSTDYLLDFHSNNDETYQESDLLRVFRSLTAEQRDICVEQCRIFLHMNNKKER